MQDWLKNGNGEIGIWGNEWYDGGGGLLWHLLFALSTLSPRTVPLSLLARGIPGRVILETTGLNHIARDFQWLTWRKASAASTNARRLFSPLIRVPARQKKNQKEKHANANLAPHRHRMAVRQQDLTHMWAVSVGHVHSG